MKTKKDLNPQAVEEQQFSNKAYKRLNQIPGYSPEALGKTFFYIKVEDYMGTGDDYFIRCTKKQAYDYRNMQRNSEREEYAYNKHIGKKSQPIDKEIIDEKGNVQIIELEDKDTESPEEYTIRQVTLREIKRLVYTRDEKDIKIYEAILAGAETDEVISRMIGLSRSTVQERKKKLIEWLSAQINK